MLRLVTLFVLLSLCPILASPISIYYNRHMPQAEFAVQEIKSALKVRQQSVNTADVARFSGGDGDQLVLLSLDEKGAAGLLQKSGIKTALLQAGGFSIRKMKTAAGEAVWIIGADKAGLMYGGLELAEQIRIGQWPDVEEMEREPYMSMRGVKFNMPLDVRTPSYSDVCDAARYRYNFISCWNLHPFPSLVRVPGYEEIALDDVQRSTVCWQEHYNLEGTGFDAPEIINNVETIKKMTMDEKIDFWRKVMAYGKSRNIDFYFITWNIFTYGTAGKYGITDEIDNPITRDYFRKSVKQMFLTYPDLKGIGLTTGENMYGASFQQKEDWAFETYARGILDAAEEQPGRKMTLIHRQHMAGALDIAEKFKPVIDNPDIEFLFSFKYAKAHVYSSTQQTYHKGFVKDIQSKGNLKTIWTLRNDDIYYFRWGAPDFVREFIQNIPYDVSRGYYYGSDQYIWGREFLMREPESPRQIEIVKHWYQWLLWGRLGYDPELSNERITQILAAKFPGVNAAKLFTAWQEASMIYPTVTGFHWGALDFKWYIESSQSRPGPANTPSGFHDVNRFITLEPHPGTDNVSIPEYVEKKLAGESIKGTTPVQVADKLAAYTDRALALLDGLNHNGDKALRHTLDDIRTMAWLGKYYEHKIRAATELAFFRETLNGDHQKEAIARLQKAAHYWRSYASLALSHYHNPLWTNRVGYVDWRETYCYVLYDITSIGGEPDVPSMLPTPGGVILEAEESLHDGLDSGSKISGFTGSGYAEFNRNRKKFPMVWNFDAPVAGKYVLEFRYVNNWRRDTTMLVSVNNEPAGDVLLWLSGSPGTWGWDRLVVELKEGENNISARAGGRILLDHVNVLYAGE